MISDEMLNSANIRRSITVPRCASVPERTVLRNPRGRFRSGFFAPDRLRPWNACGQRALPVVLCIALMAGSGAALAAQTDAAARCRGITDSAARLQCYDRLFEAADERLSPPDAQEMPGKPTNEVDERAVAVPQDRSAPAKSATKAATPAGAANDATEAPAGSASDAAPATQRIVEAGTRPTGRRWFRLDDGSVWEQVTLRRTDLSVDQAVIVTRGMVGSYHLRRADGGGRSTQVRRVN